ncbi:ABC transporter substrate-binding protein [Marinilactibacillus psychrotolerans]|uniref:Multiple sugar ABC transporter, substrate-binding protein n=1 Tax=Marinilactibacillus psychrotolerans 42ea TaxID=1255609 RepID=A0A1R4I953_9LACT|nr:ABC transporter substrate-binding protein [Marinilactibacillus psychrotolerans]GEQ32240.1 sugar ABC transporter substrate-binding protein [Marinilactibacillus psychrotolerans]SJN16357.1 Multiple sugar ABC transporter, substrate-binding protein [Marinilactibacillus psychrotolerans 42ea]
MTVDFFNQKPEITAQLEELADMYNEETDGDTRVTITTVGSGEGSAGLQARFSSGDEPALMMLGGLPEVERYSDSLIDVSELDVTDTLIDGTLEGGTIDDIPLGIPLNLEGFGWMYNREIFEEAGINPDSIQSYDDFAEAVETLDSQKEELGIDEVFAFSGGENYIANQFSANFTSPEFNESIIESYEAKELNWEYGDQMKKYTDLFNQYNVQPILTVDYSRSVEELFVNDKVAMVHQGIWIVPTLNDIDPSFAKEKLGLLPVYGESDTEGKIIAGAPFYIGVNKNLDDEVVEESKNFLDWMYTSEEGKEMITGDLAFVPAQEGYEPEDISDPVSQELYRALLAGETGAMTHKQYPDGWFQQVLYPEYQKYLNGDQTWEDFEMNTAEAFKEMR